MAIGVLQTANLAARFTLELAALGSLSYWGFNTQIGGLPRALLGVAAPLVAALVWGLFASPQAQFTSGSSKVIVQILVFGSAAVALAVAGRTAWSAAFVAAAVANAALMMRWHQ